MLWENERYQEKGREIKRLRCGRLKFRKKRLTSQNRYDITIERPIDLDAINVDLMKEDEKAYLNEYHKMVFDTVSPFLTDEEVEWLKGYTRAI